MDAGINKKDYVSPLGSQVLSLVDLVDAQLDICLSEEILYPFMSMAEISNMRKIYITGCGDSIAAAGAMAGVLLAYAEAFHCETAEPTEFARFMKLEDVGSEEPDSLLVTVISAGGGTTRTREIPEKTNEMGAFIILLTNNRESLSAKEVKRVLFLNTPKMPGDFPGLRSYSAGTAGLAALACRMGWVRGILPSGAELEFQKAVRGYAHSYYEVTESIDEQIFELAKTWKDFEWFDSIGDGPGLYSTLFYLEKSMEVTGVTANHDDSEDWCYIDYHVKNPETVGTVLFADKHAPGYGRERGTARVACGIGRPLLTVANGEREDFSEGAHVRVIPDTPEGHRWLMPLMDYAPVSLLAGCYSTLAGRKFFNELDTTLHEYNDGGRFMNPDIMTMKSSQVKIHL